uniref:Protocadherin b n=1 Tax=Maylandia zebra TaxID=106582 RepID=A0A3P9ASB3_9CICH
MDREYLCPAKPASCFLKLDVIIESPLRIFNIELGITDINDNAPHFRRDRVELDVSESATPGERFSLPNGVDPDVGINTIKTYKLSVSEHFTIEIQTGSDGTQYVDLVLTKSLDREQTAVHNLILTAVDGGVPVRSGTANIIVRVQDTNDNPPRFDKHTYTINMTENTPIGTLVMKLNASDLDEGLNSEIVYSFTLYTSEKTQEVDKGTHPLLGQCKVVVNVKDMNDNYPEIIIQSVKNTVEENVAVGSVIALVDISDRDTGDNGKVSLTIHRPMPFTINTSSDRPMHYKLIVSEPLDRETVPEYDITLIVTDAGMPPLSDNETITVHLLDILTAVDGGTPARSGTASVIVHVLDTNDNPPAFEKENLSVKILENSPIGSLVVDLNATDLDEGSNSDITYSYSLYTSEKTQETFNLNPATGEITVKGVLNHEDFRIYDMEVIAADKGATSLTGQCTIKILVEDMNDNHPEISIKSFQSPVTENIELDTVIAVVSVSDKDSGDNGIVDLHIPDNMPFKLRESSDNYYELVVSEPLDREKVPEYDITFTVTDRGSPPLSDNETMTLELLDVNDNVPQFPQSFYTIRVMENNAPGALLSSLTAFDPDLHENQYLVYFIIEKEIANTSMSMLFSINPENGNLYALKTFDYEIEKEFLFHIEARDSGSPPLSSNVTVHVIIVDQNDNAPVIVSPWRAHGSVVEEKIPRSTDKGSLIAKVIALDTDSVHNSRITYQFLQVTDATLFSLDQYNGEIRTMRMFSYRDPRHQRLVVVAKDNGEPALSATVTIKLTTMETAVKAYSDMTEEPLEYDIFSDINLYLVIGLGSVSFLLLITILVTIVIKCQKPKPSKAAPPSRNSVISERNSTIADSTLVSNDAYWYSLFLAETRKGKLVVPEYDITFTVTDRGSPPLSDNETMTLELLDVNDNVPQFPQSFYTIRVMENNAPGALLSSLTAFDPDLHENQYLVYFIIEKEIANTSMSMLFSINPENGNLYALKTFDYEIEKEFLFHIEARDSGSPPLSSNVTVHIIIVDQNDNAPVIVSPWRAHGSVVEEKIPRSTDKGSLIAKVIALDTDSVHNSRITYQFLQVTDATLFSLDQYNGEIRTMRMFSYRDPRHQRLVVVAKDNGEPALSATVTIKLTTMETAVKAYSDMTEEPLEYDIFSDINLYLVIGLGSVSFLLLITILVTIVIKCQKPKPSKAAPPSRNSVISERNSTIADSTLVSNDAYWYSLFLAETRKGKLVVRQPLPKGSRYIVSSIPRGTGLTDTSDSAASTLQVRI